MKLLKITSQLFLTIVICIAISACSKEEKVPVFDNYFSVELDGVEYSGESYVGYRENNIFQRQKVFENISFSTIISDTSNYNFALYLNPLYQIKPGETYILDHNDGEQRPWMELRKVINSRPISITTFRPNEFCALSSGKVTIEKYHSSGGVSGTFEFDLCDDDTNYVQIRKGKFSAPFNFN